MTGEFFINIKEKNIWQDTIVLTAVFEQNMIIIPSHFLVDYGDGIPDGAQAGKNISYHFQMKNESNWLKSII